MHPAQSSEYLARACASRVRVPQVLRQAAAAQSVRENVDFCVECQAFQLLFSLADRQPRAQAMWRTYLSRAADTPVNVSDSIIKKIEPQIAAAEPDTFEVHAPCMRA